MRDRKKRQKQNPRIETYLEILKQNNLLYKASKQCLKQLDESDKQMYAVCWAPALVEYVMWVLSEALQDKQERLYFLARDAYPMYLIAQQIVTKFNLRIEIRICVCHVTLFAFRNIICWEKNAWTAFFCQESM